MNKINRDPITRFHALGQRADVSDLLCVDDLVAVDEGQVGFGRHKRLTAETLKILCAFLSHQVLQVQRSRDQSAGHAGTIHLTTCTGSTTWKVPMVTTTLCFTSSEQRRSWY